MARPTGPFLVCILLALFCKPGTAPATTFCVFPKVLHDVTIENAPFEEAIEYVRLKSRLDDPERDPARRGVNIVIKPPLSKIAQFGRLTLKAKDIKLDDLVRLMGKSFRMRVNVEPFAVVFKAPDNEMFIRSFKTPPLFRSISTK